MAKPYVMCSCSVELMTGRHTLTVPFHNQHSNIRRDVARSLARFYPEEGGSVLSENFWTLRFVANFNATISCVLVYSVYVYITRIGGV